MGSVLAKRMPIKNTSQIRVEKKFELSRLNLFFLKKSGWVGSTRRFQTAQNCPKIPTSGFFPNLGWAASTHISETWVGLDWWTGSIQKKCWKGGFWVTVRMGTDWLWVAPSSSEDKAPPLATRPGKMKYWRSAFAQQCPSPSRMFAASRSGLNLYWTIDSFPQKRTRWFAL